ncbi:MAG: hypothetical protein AAF518_11335 [Spirochaetota bacterium]
MRSSVKSKTEDPENVQQYGFWAFHFLQAGKTKSFPNLSPNDLGKLSKVRFQRLQAIAPSYYSYSLHYSSTVHINQLVQFTEQEGADRVVVFQSASLVDDFSGLREKGKYVTEETLQLIKPIFDKDIKNNIDSIYPGNENIEA